MDLPQLLSHLRNQLAPPWEGGKAPITWLDYLLDPYLLFTNYYYLLDPSCSSLPKKVLTEFLFLISTD